MGKNFLHINCTVWKLKYLELRQNYVLNIYEKNLFNIDVSSNANFRIDI